MVGDEVAMVIDIKHSKDVLILSNAWLFEKRC